MTQRGLVIFEKDHREEPADIDFVRCLELSLECKDGTL